MSKPPQQSSPDVVRRKLERAAQRGRYVRVHRWIPGAESLNGFVLGVGDTWTVLALCEDLALNGYAILRTDDISRVRKREDVLTMRVLQERGEWPLASPLAEADLVDERSLLQACARLPGLVCVSMERKSKWVDACWIGVVLGLGHRSLRLHQVSPQARWHRRPSKFRLDAITAVSFGGNYERILEEFAGERPTPEVQSTVQPVTARA